MVFSAVGGALAPADPVLAPPLDIMIICNILVFLVFSFDISYYFLCFHCLIFAGWTALIFSQHILFHNLCFCSTRSRLCKWTKSRF
jgi:hypothetical protein